VELLTLQDLPAARSEGGDVGCGRLDLAAVREYRYSTDIELGDECRTQGRCPELVGTARIRSLSN
jgi:hypothetical protein